MQPQSFADASPVDAENQEPLLRCPFCGGRDVETIHLETFGQSAESRNVASCRRCGVAAPRHVWQNRVLCEQAEHAFHMIQRLASRITRNPFAHAIDRAHASGIIEIAGRAICDRRVGTEDPAARCRQ